MSIKKAKRSKIHPQRHADQIGGLGVIFGRLPVHPEHQTNMSVTCWQAFNNITQGESTEEHWAILAASINASLILAERGLGTLYVPYVTTALDAMFECQQRGNRTGAWRFTGPGMNAVRDALEVIDEQLKHVTQDQMRQALIEVERRQEAGPFYTYTENREAA